MMRVRHGRWISAVLAVVLVVAGPRAATAQYFGRNFVQWDKFDWKVMETPHFDIHFYPEETETTEDAARMAERWYTRLADLLSYEFQRKPIIFYANHPDFQQTPLGGGQIGEGTGGFTEPARNRVVMPFTGVYAENDHVLGHEMVHVFQFSIASSGTTAGQSGMGRLPLWVIEGMAEYLSLGRIDANTAMWLRDAALRGEFPTIDQLTRDPRFFPYRYGQAVWAYIAGRWGDATVPQLYRAAVRVGWEEAIRRTLGMTSDELSREWLTAVRAAYLPAAAGRVKPLETGRPILADEDDDHMNVGPVVSPDGRYIAFFSSRGLFSIDLYLADARTGKVLRRLASPRETPHFDALSFISTAGAWSPDGTLFAFTVFEEGDNRMNVVDVESGDIVRRIAVEGVGAMRDPGFSPDGSRLIFSGDVGGISDLYVYELATGRAERLTSDRFAEIQPVWSPDGRSIAFATDRGVTDFDALTYGEMQLALFDLETRTTRVLPIFAGAKHINPQFSPDGSSLYFVSDHEGVSDIFRYELASGTVFRLTNVATGVSGISELSATMSVSQRTGEVVYSAFQDGRYLILALRDLAGAQIAASADAAPPVLAILPPVRAVGEGAVASYLNDPMYGLPRAPSYAVRDYSPSLGLEYLGTPTAGVTLGQFGTGVSGGVSAFFTDMLATRSIAAVAIANGTEKDIGGQVFYRNMEGRWMWGAGAGHIPYRTGFSQIAPSEDPNADYEIQQVIHRIFQDQVAAAVHYPFSRTRRLELNGAFTRWSFDTELERFVIENSAVVGHEREEFPSCSDENVFGCTPDPLNQFQVGAAYVGDASFFGFTSPVMGWRYRYEVEPTVGTLQYVTLLADQRRYFFRSPFTFAVRGLHYGRYGPDADSERFLSPLYLGYETLVRGYAIESFEPEVECTTEQGGQITQNNCPEFERLIGSKIGVANAELRVPLFGVPGFGLINFAFLPTELAAFVDAGVAWDDDEKPELRFDRNTPERVPVVSAGLSARMNLLGYIILEAYYAYPFQRPGKGAHWGFNIAPGW